MSAVTYIVGGIATLGAAGAGTAIAVRSILYPTAERAFKDYGTPEAHGLDAEPVSLPDDIHGWWAKLDTAEVAVLLVHGRSRASGWMYPFAQKLAADATIMAIDLPGHGESRASTVSYGFKESEAVRDAVAFLEAAQDKPIVVIGVSMGGAAAIIAQTEAPSERVTGLITIGTYTDIESVFRRVSKNSALPWPIARRLFVLAARVGGFDFVQRRPVDCITKLRVPYLAVQGDADELVPVDAAARLAEACGSPLKSHIYYQGPHDDSSHPQMLAFVKSFVRARIDAVAPARSAVG